MNDNDFKRIEALFDSLKTQREVKDRIKEFKNFSLLGKGCPTDIICDFVEGSTWHRKIVKISEECVKELEDLIKNELKQLK